MNDVTAFSVAEDADHPTDTNCTLMEWYSFLIIGIMLVPAAIATFF